MLNKRILLLFLVAMAAGAAYSQQALVCAGGDATGTGGSISFSAGQVTYVTNTASNGSSAEGVQQPYEIFEVDIIEEVAGYEITAFPNPTLDIITLNFQNLLSLPVSYQLYDINGQLIEDQYVLSKLTSIDMDCLSAGTYFIRIMEGVELIKTFKVLKN